MDLDEYGFLGSTADQFEAELRLKYVNELAAFGARHREVHQRLMAAKVREFDSRGLVVIAAISRSLGHLEASLLMTVRGHPVAATALARSALESTFIAASVARSRKNLQRLRVKYFDERVTTLRWLLDQGVAELPSGEAIDAALRKASCRASRFTSFGKPGKRQGLRVKDLADAAGMGRAYKTQYAAFSFAVHPDPKSISTEHVLLENGRVVALIYEAKDEVLSMLAHLESILAIHEHVIHRYFR